jgi:hypothetical protein
MMDMMSHGLARWLQEEAHQQEPLCGSNVVFESC